MKADTRLIMAAIAFVSFPACEPSEPLGSDRDSGQPDTVPLSMVLPDATTRADTSGTEDGGTVADASAPTDTGTSPDLAPVAYTRYTSGTVTAGAWVGPATSACQQNLRITNPAQTLSSFLEQPPTMYMNDRRAGEPTYVYLDAGHDAVSLPGTAVSYGASSLEIRSPTLTTCVNEEAACSNSDGYVVKVNDRLSYLVTIQDWEDEIGLGRLDLCMSNGTVTAQLVFAGVGGYLGGGVAHEVTITAILDGAAGQASTPVTIECR